MPVLGRPPLPRTLNTVAVLVPLRLPIFPVGRVFMIRDGVKVVRPVGVTVGGTEGMDPT